MVQVHGKAAPWRLRQACCISYARKGTKQTYLTHEYANVHARRMSTQFVDVSGAINSVHPSLPHDSLVLPGLLLVYIMECVHPLRRREKYCQWDLNPCTYSLRAHVLVLSVFCSFPVSHWRYGFCYRYFIFCSVSFAVVPLPFLCSNFVGCCSRLCSVALDTHARTRGDLRGDVERRDRVG